MLETFYRIDTSCIMNDVHYSNIFNLSRIDSKLVSLKPPNKYFCMCLLFVYDEENNRKNSSLYMKINVLRPAIRKVPSAFVTFNGLELVGGLKAGGVVSVVGDEGDPEETAV